VIALIFLEWLITWCRPSADTCVALHISCNTGVTWCIPQPSQPKCPCWNYCIELYTNFDRNWSNISDPDEEYSLTLLPPLSEDILSKLLRSTQYCDAVILDLAYQIMVTSWNECNNTSTPLFIKLLTCLHFLVIAWRTSVTAIISSRSYFVLHIMICSICCIVGWVNLFFIARGYSHFHFQILGNLFCNNS